MAGFPSKYSADELKEKLPETARQGIDKVWSSKAVGVSSGLFNSFGLLKRFGVWFDRIAEQPIVHREHNISIATSMSAV